VPRYDPCPLFHLPCRFAMCEAPISAALPLQSVVRSSSRRAGDSPCNQIYFQTAKYYAAHIAASSSSAQQAVSAAAVTSLLRRCMSACRQVHLRLTAMNFRPSLLPSASALRFGISEKNGNLAKGNSPLPWVRYAPIYQRLSVAFLFRPFRRSTAPHRRSALTSPICFAEAVKKNRRAALEAAEAKQPTELQYGHQVEPAIRRARSVLLFRFRLATEPRKSRFDSQAMIKLTPENRFSSAVRPKPDGPTGIRTSRPRAPCPVQIAGRVIVDSPDQRPIVLLYSTLPQPSRNSSWRVSAACAMRIGGDNHRGAFTRIRSKSVRRESVFRCPEVKFPGYWRMFRFPGQPQRSRGRSRRTL